MGSHVVVRPLSTPPVGWELGSLERLLADEAVDLNRSYDDAMELSIELQLDTDLTLVAVDGRRVVGFVALRTSDRPSSSHVAQLRIHVARDYRSNGVGHKLLRRALLWADRNGGIERIVATPYLAAQQFWPIIPEAASKVAFFRRHGFHWEGLQRRGARLLDGTYTDVGLLARVTAPA